MRAWPDEGKFYTLHGLIQEMLRNERVLRYPSLRVVRLPHPMRHPSDSPLRKRIQRRAYNKGQWKNVGREILYIEGKNDARKHSSGHRGKCETSSCLPTILKNRISLPFLPVSSTVDDGSVSHSRGRGTSSTWVTIHAVQR